MAVLGSGYGSRPAHVPQLVGKKKRPRLTSAPSIPFQPSTTVAGGSGSPAQSQAASRQQAQAARAARRAQAKVVHRYVEQRAAKRAKETTKAAKTKAPELPDRRKALDRTRVREVKREILKDPRVRQANREGQIVTRKGITAIVREQNVERRAAQEKVRAKEDRRSFTRLQGDIKRIEGRIEKVRTQPLAGLSQKRLFKPQAAKIPQLGKAPKLQKRLAQKRQKIEPVRGRILERQGKVAAKGDPSTWEALQWASMGIPIPGGGAVATRAIARLGKAVGIGRKAQAVAKPALSVRAVQAGGRKVAPKTAARAGKAAGKAPKPVLKAGRFAARHPFALAAGGAAATHPKETAAFVEGTATADFGKSFATTAKAVPATFAFLGTAAADAAYAAWHRDPSSLKGTASEFKKAILGAEDDPRTPWDDTTGGLAALWSGDAEKVRKATEEEVGYAFAPLLPRGFVSGPARVARKGIAKGTRKVIPKRPPPKGVTGPSRARRAWEIATGGPRRKRIATLFERERGPEIRAASNAMREMEKPLIKGKLTSENDAALVGIIVRHGVHRDRARLQLREVERSLDPADAGDIVNVRTAVAHVERHPEVLSNKYLWEAVEAARARLPDIETSRRASRLGQARALSHVTGETIHLPEHRVPVGARAHTQARTRGEAWADYEGLQKTVTQERATAREFMVRAQEAKGARRTQLLRRADEHRATAKLAARRAKPLYRELSRFPGRPRGGKTPDPSHLTARLPWDRQLVDEFSREVDSLAKEHGWAKPHWVSERVPGEGPEVSPRHPAGPSKAPFIQKGTAGLHDVVDRSFQAFSRDSVFAPRMRRALHRITARFAEEFSIPKEVRNPLLPNGRGIRRVITREDIARNRVDIDPRTEVLMPQAQWGRAIEDEGFYLDDFHGSVKQRIQNEKMWQADEPGTKYIVLRREDAYEFADQVNPSGGRLEQALTGAGGFASWAMLYNPAWAMAQVVNEGSQFITAMSSPRHIAAAIRTNAKIREQHPREYEAMAGRAGPAHPPQAQPGTMRMHMGETGHGSFLDASRGMRRNRAGRIIYGAGNIFRVFDQFKTGKFRTTLYTASVHRELNGFLNGVRGMLKEQDAISRKLAGMDNVEAMRYINKTPKLFDKHLNYLDDVAGNWGAFTRFERDFAPLAIFYGYLRMSVRWTMWAYPMHHPVKASLLYTLGQQNRQELKKLTGGQEPNIFELPVPVVHTGEGGRVAGVLPGGQRFGAPGLNVIAQSIGDDNLSGLIRGLNPILSIPIYAATGIDPMSGTQDKYVNRGALVLGQLLSLSPAARLLEINRIGREETAVGRAYEENDPHRATRSFFFPFLPQDAEGFRKSANLSRALDTSAKSPKAYGEFEDAVKRFGAQEAFEMVRRGGAAGRAVGGAVRGKETKGEKKQYETFSDLYYEAKYGNKDYRAALRDAGKKEQEAVSQFGFGQSDTAGYGFSKDQTASYGFGSGGGGGGNGGGRGRQRVSDRRVMPTTAKGLGRIAKFFSEVRREPHRGFGFEGDDAHGKIVRHEPRPKGAKAKAAERELRRAVSRSVEIDAPLTPQQKRFAESFARASGLSPRVAAAAVLREGGNNTPGDNNWLNIGWDGSPDQAIRHAPEWRDPKAAGEAAGKWLNGQFGQRNNYVASDGIQAISSAQGDEAQMQAWANSGWAENGASPADTYDQVGVRTRKLPPALVKRAKKMLGEKQTKEIMAGPQGAAVPKRYKGKWGGSQKAALSQIPKAFRAEGRGDKRTPEENAAVGGSSTSDHLTTNKYSYGADLPADDKLAQQIARNLGMPTHTGTNEVTKDGYRYQLIWQDAGHYDHIHLGATWTGEAAPSGTTFGGSYATTPSGAGGVALTPSGKPSLPSPPKPKTPSQSAQQRLGLLKQVRPRTLEGVAGIGGEPNGQMPTVGDLAKAAESYRKTRRRLLG